MAHLWSLLAAFAGIPFFGLNVASSGLWSVRREKIYDHTSAGGISLFQKQYSKSHAYSVNSFFHYQTMSWRHK